MSFRKKMNTRNYAVLITDTSNTNDRGSLSSVCLVKAKPIGQVKTWGDHLCR